MRARGMVRCVGEVRPVGECVSCQASPAMVAAADGLAAHLKVQPRTAWEGGRGHSSKEEPLEVRSKRCRCAVCGGQSMHVSSIDTSDQAEGSHTTSYMSRKSTSNTLLLSARDAHKLRAGRALDGHLCHYSSYTRLGRWSDDRHRRNMALSEFNSGTSL